MRTPASTYARALEGNLLEMWVAGSGMTIASNTVLSWSGVLRGLTWNAVTTPRAPSYAVDSGYFKGRPVVQFSKAVSPPTGFARLDVPVLGTINDIGCYFVVGRMRVDTTAADLECLMEAYVLSGGQERVVALDFDESTNHGYATEGYCNAASFHPFTNGQAGYLTPHLIHGSNGYTGVLGCYCGIDQTIVIAPSGAPYKMGQVQWLCLGLETRIDRGCNFSLCAAGWCRDPMTAGQTYALMKLLANEWGTPEPV